MFETFSSAGSESKERKANTTNSNYIGMFKAKVLVIGPCEVCMIPML